MATSRRRVPLKVHRLADPTRVVVWGISVVTIRREVINSMHSPKSRSRSRLAPCHLLELASRS